MCGIAAIFSLDGKKDLSSIVIMTRLVKHRGPDGEGIVLFEDESCLWVESEKGCMPFAKAALGHRRLSILDLSDAGRQPMNDGPLWITYNGEIYNYLEIRAELQKEGVAFRTETDTEVILKAYQAYGIQFLEKLNGMFSFVLLDRKLKKAFAVRDRFGVKPLYYFEGNGCLSFASEIKQFQAIPYFEARLNHQRAYDFLNYGVFDHTDETLFRRVHQILGGHYAEIDLQKGCFHIMQWYHLPQREAIGYKEAVEQCQALLRDSVKIRLRSDVEVGSCLSGGIDSSSIVCLASSALKENGHSRQKTFSARSEDPRIDEFVYMEKVKERSGSDAFYVTPIAEGLLQSFDQLLWHQDEPFASSSVFAQYALFSKVKDEGVKVMLDGQGADEQLGGYFEFYGIYLNQLMREGRFADLVKELKGAKKNNSTMNPFRSLFKNMIPHGVKEWLYYLMNKPSSKCPWIDFNVLECKPSPPHDSINRKTFNSYAKEMLLKVNLPMLLHYEDRNSMAHSVESRTPFLDYRFVEFILSLPPHFFIRNGMAKMLLRDAMRGIVPEEVLMRKDKIAFATDERRWLKENKASCMSLIKDAVKTTGIFTPAIIPKTEAILEGKKPFSFLPFRVIAFSKWFNLNRVCL